MKPAFPYRGSKRRGGVPISACLGFCLLFVAVGTVAVNLLSIWKQHKQQNTQATNLQQQPNAIAASSSSYSETTPVTILLQQSPVDQSSQLLRLLNIDESWARWTDGMQIYAALPTDGDLHKEAVDKLRVLRPLALWKADQKNALGLSASSSASPMRNMIQMLCTLLFTHTLPSFASATAPATAPATSTATATATATGDLKWLLIANDHTFVIPPNLQCFSSRFDSALPLYSGNKLQRGMYRDVFLDFASGGAGVLVSHVSVKFLLIAWLLTNNNVLASVLAEAGDEEGEGEGGQMCVIEKSSGSTLHDVNIDIELTMSEHALSAAKQAAYRDKGAGGEGDLAGLHRGAKGGSLTLCSIRKLSKWLLKEGSSSSTSTASIALSELVSIQLTKDKGFVGQASASATSVSVRVDVVQKKSRVNEQQETYNIDRKKLLLCNDESPWARINPMLVSAYCMLHVFRSEWVDSTVPAAVDEHAGGVVAGSVTNAKLSSPSSSPSSSSSSAAAAEAAAAAAAKRTDPNNFPPRPLTPPPSERFNVFGVVRTVNKDLDNWYRECKLLLPPSFLDAAAHKSHPAAPASSTHKLFIGDVASDVISFHYVSQREAHLLYAIISGKEKFASASQLYEAWPKEDKDVGHYSTKLRSMEEAQAVWDLLYKKVSVVKKCPR